MNIALSPKIQEMIQEKVDHGDYAGPDEVVGEALKLLEDRDRKLNRLSRRSRSRERKSQEAKGRSGLQSYSRKSGCELQSLPRAELHWTPMSARRLRIDFAPNASRDLENILAYTANEWGKRKRRS